MHDGGSRTDVVEEEGDDPLFEDDALLVLDEPKEGLCPPPLVKGHKHASFLEGREEEGREGGRGKVRTEESLVCLARPHAEHGNSTHPLLALPLILLLLLLLQLLPLLRLGPAGVRFRRQASMALSTTSSTRTMEEPEEEMEDVGRSTLG